MSPTKARVLIVDDHPIVRDGIRFLIEQHPDLELCAEAETMAQACRLVDRTGPDIVIVDLVLRDGSGIDLIKRLMVRNPSMKIAVFTMHDESLYAERALRAGAMGYVHKQEGGRKLIEAIHYVLEGRVYLAEATAARLLKRAVNPQRCDQGHSPIENLSDRELEVFDLIGNGLKLAEIASRMHLSSKTVATYRDRIRTKLNLGSSTELVHNATRWVTERSFAT